MFASDVIVDPIPVVSVGAGVAASGCDGECGHDHEPHCTVILDYGDGIVARLAGDIDTMAVIAATIVKVVSEADAQVMAQAFDRLAAMDVTDFRLGPED